MATANDIITVALRLLGVVASGEAIPADQARDGLAALNALLDSLPSNGVGCPLSPVNVSRDYATGGNEALFLPVGGVTITLPAAPMDGMRVQVIDVGAAFGSAPVKIVPTGRLMDGQAAPVSLAAAGTNRTWMYRADLGDWRSMGALTATNPVPYPSRFDEGLAAMLAIRLAPTYGMGVPDAVALMARDGQQAMAAAYTQLGAPASLDHGLRLMFSTRSRRLF